MSGDPEQQYFSDGITEDIITELSRFRSLFVIARTSSFQYRGKNVDVRQVARELGVQYVVEGSIRRAGNRVRVTAQLVDAGTGSHRWADRFDREFADIFALQDEVTRRIVTNIAGSRCRVAAAGKAQAAGGYASLRLFPAGQVAGGSRSNLRRGAGRARTLQSSDPDRFPLSPVPTPIGHCRMPAAFGPWRLMIWMNGESRPCYPPSRRLRLTPRMP